MATMDVLGTFISRPDERLDEDVGFGFLSDDAFELSAVSEGNGHQRVGKAVLLLGTQGHGHLEQEPERTRNPFDLWIHRVLYRLNRPPEWDAADGPKGRRLSRLWSPARAVSTGGIAALS